MITLQGTVNGQAMVNGVDTSAIRLAVLSMALAATSCTSAATDATDPPPSPSASERSAVAPASPNDRASQGSLSVAAEAFTSYAVGGPLTVPWAEEVTYRIAGERVARLDPALANRRKSWQSCPAGAATYEGRECPVSPLRLVRQLDRAGGTVVYESTAPRTVGCNRYRTLPVDALASMWIRPDDRHRDCFSDFAIAVSLNDAGRISAVDLALSGP